MTKRNTFDLSLIVVIFVIMLYDLVLFKVVRRLIDDIAILC